MARLLVIKGADEGKQFELDVPQVTLGRESVNRIRLHDTEVSRRHAEFHQVDGQSILIDVGSANGTFVNNDKVQKVTLQPGDRILIGQTTMVYSSSGQQRAEKADDLAEKISMISRADMELSSAIVKTIGEAEGSRILSQPDSASPWLKNALANLSIMYEASQAVSHILDLGQLLDRILELVFRSIVADRGCFMLKNPQTGELEPKAIRWRDGKDHKEKFNLTRTITDHVLKERQGVLVSDAARDERFSAGQSIVRLGIREVICVPMRGRHETLGVLYLDTHSTPKEMMKKPTATAKLTEDHLALASAVAHQAALAVEETHYYHAMIQAERLAAIGQTIASLSHHIKNILQGLRSGSEILSMGLKEKNDTLIQQGWRIAEKNQGKIYDLVMDMLSFSKEREPAVEPTDVNDIARDIVELLSARAKEAKIKLEISLSEDLPIIPVDPEGIHRALLNIVGNALDAVDGRPDAHVTVGTRPADGTSVNVVVLDNGTGIAPDKIEDIFKPFVSTKGAKGTGLGLPVSRKILREHGGDITVASQIGVGSKFTLRLPIKSPYSADPNSSAVDMPMMPPDPE